MRLIRLGAASINQTPLDWDGNRSRIVDTLDAARDSGVSILCLPELCIPGYGCEDAFLSPGVHRLSLEVLGEIVPHTRGLVVSLGLPLLVGRSLFNVACLVADGRIAGFVAKRHLAGGGVYYEPRWFRPWPSGGREMVALDGAQYPLGDHIFDCGGVRVGFEICEDAWVADRPGGHQALRGVDVMLNPSASHFAFGKQKVRQRYVAEGSRAFGVAYVYSNLLGNDAGRIIYDGGTLIADRGELVAAGRRFSFRDCELATAVVDIEASRVALAGSASYREDVAGGDDVVTVDFSYPELVPEPPAERTPDWETSDELKSEEFTRAVALGLFDYLRKSRSHGFVVSLSGGADSSAVSCLVALMVDLAMADLGREGVAARLSHVSGIDRLVMPRDFVRRLLLCVYQATEQSGLVTRSAARRLADDLGADFLELDVDPHVRAYVELIEGAVGRQLSWERDDVALQNIQARARGPGVWMLANLRRALLLSTSNRSEAAVGYATMDGDTCGGLSPIAGIDKAFLRAWLRWLEKVGPAGVDPVPALEAVNSQEPTAELRPPGAAQTDETDLMPYELLDAIEDAAIRDKHTPREVFLEMRAQFPTYTAEQLYGYVARFFRLWCRNQWKRERYAPSFHVDDKNLDPKTWCRFPILSGGFERELDELRAYVEAREVRGGVPR